MFSIGTDSSVNCNFNDVSVVFIQWEKPDRSVITTDNVLGFTANDSIHHVQFLCRGYDSFHILVGELLFKVIVNGKRILMCMVQEYS